MRSLFALAALAAFVGATTVAAAPATCGNPCTIDSFGLGYVPPAASLANNTTVVFTSLDSTHVHADKLPVGTFDECFVVASAPGSPSPGVRFGIWSGKLWATAPNATGVNETKECVTAQPLPDGSFLLPIYCKLHPLMRTAVVVSPAP